jgi:hypothetical protein
MASAIMAQTSEPSLLGERLRSLKQSMMNSRLLMRMVLPRQKPLSIVTASVDEGTIRTSKGKAPLPGAPTVSVLCTSKNKVVKITCSSSEVVL